MHKDEAIVQDDLCQHCKIFSEIALAYERAKSTALGHSGLLRIGVVATPAMGFIHKPLRESSHLESSREV